ncbi:MAG: hypothetical protein Q9205_003874 [Flavoplaca limonia]
MAETSLSLASLHLSLAEISQETHKIDNSMSSPTSGNNHESFWQIYHESEDLVAAADRQYLEPLEHASHEHRQLLKQHAFDLLNRGTVAATEEDRDRFSLTAAAYLERARHLVPWCLAVEILASDVENWDGCEDDEMLIKGLAVSRALQVYDEECL